MSWVTDVLLIMSVEKKFDDDFNEQDTCEAVDNINAWLTQRDKGELDDLSTHVRSGGKAMQCYVYGGAFNFLDVDEFISLVLSQQWKKPESVMLLIKDEEQETFTTHQID